MDTAARAPEVALEAREQALLAGAEGRAMQLAMRVLLRAAEVSGATRFVDVGFAPVSACFYNGQAHVDFAQYLVDNGAHLSVATWTNTSLVSNTDGHLRTGVVKVGQDALRLMRLYERLGCRGVWTCAPYQLPDRPSLGDHIVGSESNAMNFYNSVVGVRSNKYGDFIDVCAALAGIVLGTADVNLAVGSVVAAQLYAKQCPVVALKRADDERVRSGDSLDMEAGGRFKVTRHA